MLSLEQSQGSFYQGRKIADGSFHFYDGLSIKAVDYDNNTLKDVLFKVSRIGAPDDNCWPNYLSWRSNESENEWSNEQVLSSAEPCFDHLTFNTGDLDNDGDEDILSIENPFGLTLITNGFPSALEMNIPLPKSCLLYTSPSPRDLSTSRMPSSA